VGEIDGRAYDICYRRTDSGVGFKCRLICGVFTRFGFDDSDFTLFERNYGNQSECARRGVNITATSMGEVNDSRASGLNVESSTKSIIANNSRPTGLSNKILRTMSLETLADRDAAADSTGADLSM